MSKSSTLPAFVLAALMLGSAASAGVSPNEAARLDNELTPSGAIRAGNADGTIPAWEGGLTTPPPDYSPGIHHPDPFATDQVLFTISAANLDEYADKLSPGQIAMLKRYPTTWNLQVYPTRRSASMPPAVYEAMKANAVNATLTNDGNGVAGAALGPAFPIPKQGVEAIWNHLLRYRGKSFHRYVGQAAPTSGGSYTMTKLEESALFPYSHPGATSESVNNRLGYFLQEITAPPRLAGRVLLVHETLDQAKEARRAWVYTPGQRRVRRAPNIAYDNPGTASDGQRTNDQLDMFNGAPDRYNWELVGRQEMVVPYNTYKLHSDSITPNDVIQAGHINPDVARYELHRVWVVDATIKEGTSHIYARRTFYLDEDSWQILAVDQYDGRGEIWRYSEAYCINYYEAQIFWDTLQVHYDLQNGRYLAFGFNNNSPAPEFDISVSASDFTPESLRRKGRR